MAVAILGGPTEANVALARAWDALGLDAFVASPADVRGLGPGDTLLTRVDVLPTLDGVGPGLSAAAEAEARGVRVLNRPRPLLAAHDKLLTARVLARAEVPQPRTWHVPAGRRAALPPAPAVVKPRYGSWGADVFRCATAEELGACLDAVAGRPWFRRHGALVQELVPAAGYDLRVLVAGGEVVGAITRHPRPREWRTNTSLGARRMPARPGSYAAALARAAAKAVGCDLVGVDLLPLPGGDFAVLELNGAVDFDGGYSLPGRDAYADAARALALLPAALPLARS